MAGEVVLPTVAREDFSHLELVLSSNEQLGVLDTDYLEDAHGVDGQVTLHNMETGDEVPLLMAESYEAEAVPHEVFRGFCDIMSLIDGTYEVRGRVRDLVGNVRVLAQQFILTSDGVRIALGWFRVVGARLIQFPPLQHQLAVGATVPELHVPFDHSPVVTAPPRAPEPEFTMPRALTLTPPSHELTLRGRGAQL